MNTSGCGSGEPQQGGGCTGQQQQQQKKQKKIWQQRNAEREAAEETSLPRPGRCVAAACTVRMHMREACMSMFLPVVTPPPVPSPCCDECSKCWCRVIPECVVEQPQLAERQQPRHRTAAVPAGQHLGLGQAGGGGGGHRGCVGRVCACGGGGEAEAGAPGEYVCTCICVFM